MNAAFFVVKECWKKFVFPLFSKEELDLYQYLSKMPTSQVGTELGELRKAMGAIRKAIKSQKADSKDCISKYCSEAGREL
jgi:hypothetical protein